MAAFLMDSTALTDMDKVVPKVAGVESWELTFKLCRRWGYKIKKIRSHSGTNRSTLQGGVVKRFRILSSGGYKTTEGVR